LSWFEPLLVMLSDNPLHEPTPVPTGTCAPTLAVPLIEKSACVHAGFELSACAEKLETVAVTEPTYTGEELPFVKSPARATEPPGYRPLEVDVWFTVTLTGAVVAADPVPEPEVVQYAYPATAATAIAVPLPRTTQVRFVSRFISFASSFSARESYVRLSCSVSGGGLLRGRKLPHGPVAVSVLGSARQRC
jgi:hypothetical protein